MSPDRDTLRQAAEAAGWTVTDVTEERDRPHYAMDQFHRPDGPWSPRQEVMTMVYGMRSGGAAISFMDYRTLDHTMGAEALPAALKAVAR